MIFEQISVANHSHGFPAIPASNHHGDGFPFVPAQESELEYHLGAVVFYGVDECSDFRFGVFNHTTEPVHIVDLVLQNDSQILGISGDFVSVRHSVIIHRTKDPASHGGQAFFRSLQLQDHIQMFIQSLERHGCLSSFPLLSNYTDLLSSVQVFLNPHVQPFDFRIHIVAHRSIHVKDDSELLQHDSHVGDLFRNGSTVVFASPVFADLFDQLGHSLMPTSGLPQARFCMEEGDGITFDVPDSNTIIVKGIDKQKVGQTAAVIRGKRPPEPYHGKGVKYENEYVRRKSGKAGKGK